VAVRFPERFPVRISTGIPGEIEWSVRLSSKALHVPCRFHTPLVPLAFIFCAFNFPGNPALKEEVTSLLRREGRMKEEVRGCRKREGRSKGGRSFTGHPLSRVSLWSFGEEGVGEATFNMMVVWGRWYAHYAAV